MTPERVSRSPERQDDGRWSEYAASRWASIGIVGLLASALVAFGVAPLLLPDSYSAVEHGISESAAQGIEQA